MIFWRKDAEFFMQKAENEKNPKNDFSVNIISRDEQKCISACHTIKM